MKDELELNEGATEAGTKKAKKRRKLKLSDKIIIAIFNPLLAIIIAAAIVLWQPYQEYLLNKTVYDEPTPYSNVFVAALGDKYERLCSVDSPKIAVVGGSSVAFGLDSGMLGQYTDREVVNFGLYATLGSKIMLDLSEDGLNPGDIVVFAPELNAQTMSLYFGTRSAWQAIDADRDIYETVYRHNGEELEADKVAFAEEKAQYIADGAPDPSGVYNSKNFNSYGDISYPRPYNTMALGYDPNTTFSFTSDIISPDFLEYFNNYCERLKANGVTVYFSFCPINDMAVDASVTEETIAEFEQYLKENLNCKVISSLSDYIIDWGYFYDTNLHLNDEGVKLRTQMLINDLRFELKLGDNVSLGVAPPPGIEGAEVIDGNDQHADLFIYEPVTVGDTVVGLSIVGLSEKGLAFEGAEVIIPSKYEDVPVIILGSDVLAGLKNVTTVTIGANISSINDAAFRGCSALTSIIIEFGTECLVTIPGENEPGGLMEGAPEGCVIICAPEDYNDFITHYTWSHYSKYFAKP